MLFRSTDFGSSVVGRKKGKRLLAQDGLACGSDAERDGSPLPLSGSEGEGDRPVFFAEGMGDPPRRPVRQGVLSPPQVQSYLHRPTHVEGDGNIVRKSRAKK